MKLQLRLLKIWAQDARCPTELWIVQDEPEVTNTEVIPLYQVIIGLNEQNQNIAKTGIAGVSSKIFKTGMNHSPLFVSYIKGLHLLNLKNDAV
jgi:hypothetical protein